MDAFSYKLLECRDMVVDLEVLIAMNVTIYHNPRCSKSRQTLELIESHGLKPKIVEYLNNPPEADTLLQLARRLGVPLSAILRSSEAEYTASEDGPPIDDERELAKWLHRHPSVLERPIVVDEDSDKAVIGRPPENVLDLLPR